MTRVQLTHYQGGGGISNYYEGSHIKAIIALFPNLNLSKEDFPTFSGMFYHSTTVQCSHTINNAHNCIKQLYYYILSVEIHNNT